MSASLPSTITKTLGLLQLAFISKRDAASLTVVASEQKQYAERILETMAPNQSPVPEPLERDFIPRCGDCWCIFGEPENGDVCPLFSEGYSDSFPKAISDTYNTFQINANASDTFSLKSSSGEDCYPFSELAVDTTDYPVASRPQCEYPAKSDLETAVCAYKFDEVIEDVESCPGRSYSMKTYDSLEAAEAAGAQLTHRHSCGVCSDAENLATMMATLNKLEAMSKTCGTVYFSNIFVLKKDPGTEFNNLVKCYENIGFKGDCAVMWSHWTATTIHVCNDECVQNLDPNNYGPPPKCELSSCLTCTEKMRISFDKLNGRSFWNSGMVSDVAHPCESIYSVIHEPCGGGLKGVTDSPTLSPTSNGSLRVSVFLFGVCFFVSAYALGL